MVKRLFFSLWVTLYLLTGAAAARGPVEEQQLGEKERFEERRKAFTKTRELLVQRNVPFDPDALLTSTWRQDLKNAFARMPEMQVDRWETSGRLEGVQFARNLVLAEKTRLTGDTVIVADSVVFLGREAVLYAPGHDVSLFPVKGVYHAERRRPGAPKEEKKIYVITGRLSPEERVLVSSLLDPEPIRVATTAVESLLTLMAGQPEPPPAPNCPAELDRCDGLEGSPGDEGEPGGNPPGAPPPEPPPLEPGANGTCTAEDHDGKTVSAPGNTGVIGGEGGMGEQGGDGGPAGDIQFTIPPDPIPPDSERPTWKLSATGGNGGSGGQGGVGGPGGAGGRGGRGGNGAECSELPAGNGGDGGNGGQGGKGGTGGTGGKGGKGGNGGRIDVTYCKDVTTIKSEQNNGDPGPPGPGSGWRRRIRRFRWSRRGAWNV